LTITAPTGKAKQVDLVAVNFAIIMKYSSQVGREDMSYIRDRVDERGLGD
jgi:hypothetical protein